MNSSKLYLLTSTKGCYDDFSVSIHGIFDNPVLAEEGKRKIEERIEEMRNAPCPITNYDPENEDYLTTDEMIKLCRWENNKIESDEFNGCTIEEMTLNELSRLPSPK